MQTKTNQKALWLSAFLALQAAAHANNWSYVGMDGVYATTIATDPLRNRVFVGTIEGFQIYDQAGGTWTEQDWEGWVGRVVWSVDYSDTQPMRVITGRENAWFKGYLEYSDDLGATETIAYNSNGGAVVDVTHDGGYHYACTVSDIAPGEFLRSSDEGQSWTQLLGHGHFTMTDLSFDIGGELVLTGDAGVMRSADSGASWTSSNGDLPAGYGVYCATGANLGSASSATTSLLASLDLGVYYSDSNGQWSQKLSAAARNLMSFPAEVPGAPDIVVAVTFSGKVMVTQDLGESWIDETGDLPGLAIEAVYLPSDNSLYVITSNKGAWRKDAFPTSEPGVAYCYCAQGPCANNDSSAGCANSSQAPPTQGAKLAAMGSGDSDMVDLLVSGLPINVLGVFFQGDNRIAIPFGDGLRCAGGSVLRLGAPRHSGMSGSVGFGPGFGDVPITVSSGALPGETKRYQFWYRDNAGPCGAGFNTSNGYEITWW